MNNPINIQAVAQTAWCTSDLKLTREAYYFLLDMVAAVSSNISLGDLQILQSFDDIGTPQIGTLSTQLESVLRSLSILPDQNATVGQLRQIVQDLQTLVSLVSADESAAVGGLRQAVGDLRVLQASTNEFHGISGNTLVSPGLLSGAGAPVDGSTGAGVATPGVVDYLDTTNLDRYMNAGTLAAPAWKLWGRSA